MSSEGSRGRARWLSLGYFNNTVRPMPQAMNDNATPTLDAVFAVLSAPLPAWMGWALKGWAEHMRQTRHQNHAANSWAKHHREFGRLHDQAQAITLARCIDFGVKPDEAAALLRERVEARDAKALALAA